MLRKIKKLFGNRSFYVETNLKIISLIVEKTYPVFVGTLNDKISKRMPFVVGKTEYGPIKVPLSEQEYKILRNKIGVKHNKIPIEISVKLKIQKIKKDGHFESKILAGKVLLEMKKE